MMHSACSQLISKSYLVPRRSSVLSTAQARCVRSVPAVNGMFQDTWHRRILLTLLTTIAWCRLEALNDNFKEHHNISANRTANLLWIHKILVIRTLQSLVTLLASQTLVCRKWMSMSWQRTPEAKKEQAKLVWGADVNAETVEAPTFNKVSISVTFNLGLPWNFAWTQLPKHRNHGRTWSNGLAKSHDTDLVFFLRTCSASEKPHPWDRMVDKWISNATMRFRNQIDWVRLGKYWYGLEMMLGEVDNVEFV